MLKPHR